MPIKEMNVIPANVINGIQFIVSTFIPIDLIIMYMPKAVKPIDVPIPDTAIKG